MVMAESERATRPDSNNTSPTTRLQWLRQRREALQEKLIRKNNELKNLCIDEAELTGVLPPEIPLDPGESPPLFRKRVGTSFAYPQNLINKLKTNQVEESALELERQVQSEIAKAAYAIVNDSAESKSVRRKHRQIYQQSQRRLKELEIRLNFIRQGYGHLARRSNPPENWQSASLNSINDDNNSLGKIGSKHRTKKPRPPLETASDKEISTKITDKGTILQETEVNLPTGTPFDFYNTKPRYMKHSNCSPVDHNENPDHSIFPDHYRTRTYSHGNIDEPSVRHLRKSQFEEKTYRNAPSMYNLEVESRVSESQHWQQRKYLDPGYLQGLRQHQLDQYKQSQIKPQRFYYQDRLSPLEKTSAQPYNEVLDQVNPRNTMPHYRYTHPRVQEALIHHGNMENLKESTMSRQENEIPRRNINEPVTMPRHKMASPNDNWTPHVDEVPWYPENHSQQETFGSLDRRKHVLHQSMKETNSPPMRYPVSAQQHRLDQLPPPPPPPPPPHTRILLRTQSLGSVETWHPGAAALPSQHGSGTIESPTGSSTRDSYGPRGPREKEWYETSMDFGYQAPPPTLERTLSMQRTNPVGHVTYPRSSPSPSISSSPKPPTPSTPPLPTSSPCFNDIATKIPPKSEKDLEIPAESSNHAGKYQSYREVTKPFEMSDFYKYSTKFRKKQEQVASPRVMEHQANLNGNNNNGSFTNNNVPVVGNIGRRPPVPSNYIPVQRRAFEAQMMPGQPYPHVRTNDDVKKWDSQKPCLTSPNDTSVV